mmetsp:Transcript_32980/g.72035  ORF Transcript_32980/g.72035 Transcript_32980/m.72035 type:complete len:264 (+) Transcript_32980:857-1648(+)
MLHRELDVNTRSIPRNLDPVRQGAGGAVGPTGPAVLRDVLIQHGGAEVDTVLVTPGEISGVRGRSGERIVGRRCRGVLVPGDAQLLELVPAPDLARPLRRLQLHRLLPGLLLGMAVPVHRTVHVIGALRHREVSRHCPRTGSLDGQRAVLHPGVAILAPVLAPRVADHPVLALLRVGTPPNHTDNMVWDQTEPLGDAPRVLLQSHGIHLAGNGPTVVNLPHDGLPPHDHPVVPDGRVGVAIQCSTLLALTGPRDVLRGAREVG